MTTDEPGRSPEAQNPSDNDEQALIRRMLEAATRPPSQRRRFSDWAIVWRARSERRTEVRSTADLGRDSLQFDLELKQKVARFALRAVTSEVVFANGVFLVYAWAGEHWRVPSSAIEVWLGATVVQIVGILYIITRYLFPPSGSTLAQVREAD